MRQLHLEIFMSKKVLALIAVRMKSTRLTAKAMKDLSGAPLILKLHHRLLKSKRLNGIVWCTSTNEQDNQLQELAEHNNISFYRGSELDVIDRFLAPQLMFFLMSIFYQTLDVILYASQDLYY